jgi:thiol:disulfide interchange protein
MPDMKIRHYFLYCVLKEPDCMKKIPALCLIFSLLLNNNSTEAQTSSSPVYDTLEIIEDTTTEEDSVEIPTLVNYYSGTFNDIYQYAQKNKKIILLDFTASWCLPCTQMKKYTFNDTLLTEYLNKNIVVYRVNLEELDAFEIAEQFQVVEYPTLIFLNPNKKVLKKLIGFQSAKDMLGWAKKCSL